MMHYSAIHKLAYFEFFVIKQVLFCMYVSHWRTRCLSLRDLMLIYVFFVDYAQSIAQSTKVSAYDCSVLWYGLLAFVCIFRFFVEDILVFCISRSTFKQYSEFVFFMIFVLFNYSSLTSDIYCWLCK